MSDIARRKRYILSSSGGEIRQCQAVLLNNLEERAKQTGLDPRAFRIRVPPPGKEEAGYCGIETTWPEKQVWDFVSEVMERECLSGRLLYQNEKLLEMSRNDLKRLLA